MRLIRDDQDAMRTLGAMFDGEERLVETLELPWLDNKHNISCIPEGVYQCELRYSPKHGRFVYWIMGVPDREDVEIHIGNFVQNTLGCVLVGTSRGDNVIFKSQLAFRKFMSHMGGVKTFTLDITKLSVKEAA